MTLKLSKQTKKEVYAVLFLILWVIAYIVQIKTGQAIPWPLNVAMTGAAGTLLAMSLPFEIKRSGDTHDQEK